MISCVAPKLNPALADLAISLGSHFCDLGGNEDMVKQELALHEEAQSRGVWVVPNCGLAPGLLNILCMHGVEQFEEVEAAYLRAGHIPLAPNPPFNFQVSSSASKLVDDYTHPVALLKDHALSETEPLTGKEVIHFPPPYGALEGFYSAGGLSVLPENLLGKVKTLDYKKISRPGHADQMRFVIALGFADKRSISVRTLRTYRDVFIRNLRKNLGGNQPDAMLLRVVVTGTKDGRRQSFLAEMIDHYNEAEAMTATKRGTAFPASAIAQLLAQRKIPGGGAAPPEQIVPKALFFDALQQRGLHIAMSWHDGALDVTQIANTPALT